MTLPATVAFPKGGFRATLWRLERAKLDLDAVELPGAIERLAALRARLVGLLVAAEGARLVEEALPPGAPPWAR